MLNFALQLDERLVDRVFVSVLLGPDPDNNEPVVVDGVAVALIGIDGEPLSSRLMLPIAGTLQQPVLTTVELRAVGTLPHGTRVLGTAWSGNESFDACIPADPGTQLEAHCRGTAAIATAPDLALVFEPLDPGELGSLQAAFPWLIPRPRPPLTVMDGEPDLRQACQDLGLGDEDMEWLEDLLNE